jgi:signal transduction histidine kinase
MRRVLHLSPITAVLALVVAAASIVGFFFFKNSADQQERTLLKSDNSQAALYVGSVFGGVSSILDTLATAQTLSNGSAAAFTGRARVVDPNNAYSLVMATKQGAGYVVTAAVGPGYSPGQELGPSVLAALSHAGATLDTSVDYEGTKSTGVFAVGPPLTLPATAIFLQFTLDPYVKSPVTAAKPFALLKVALYGAPTADQRALLVATAPKNQLPLTGDTVTDHTKVGEDTWTLVAVARSPLTGSFARQAPYIILGLGLFVALLMAVAVEILDRRQRYAKTLVQERTADLESTLAELRAAQGALVRGERLRALGEMASVVGHELRNPLAAVINALYLLRRQLGDPAQPAHEKHLAMAERETAKAAALAEDLTAFVRPRQPQKEDVDVPALLREVAEAAPPPPHVALDVNADPFTLVVDRHQLSEVLTNLMTNAYQAVNGDGRVQVSARTTPGGAELSVEDNGPGIDADTAQRLFEPFFTTKHGGTGLGLAIVQRLVEAHGGTVAFEEGEGPHGARVVVRLPAEVVQSR